MRVLGKENHNRKEETGARPITGTDRIQTGERAAEVGALRVFEENVDKADTNLLQAGNFTACPTMTAIKKMAAEYREKHQLDLDYYNEIRLLSNALEAADI
ncbi:unnamed protein product [Didymodactylos carnosus]|uniref:Uncharacterized protein n=1 Tax=Didymodactylos carnosus TaxID=1234261 RepID=A0A815VB62_9BILA|nr:unnamed protein product [Didymodactylos carnosus]CAF4386969.1 unnamed protein product [Didymodactylos carnosus]